MVSGFCLPLEKGAILTREDSDDVGRMLSLGSGPLNATSASIACAWLPGGVCTVLMSSLHSKLLTENDVSVCG